MFAKYFSSLRRPVQIEEPEEKPIETPSQETLSEELIDLAAEMAGEDLEAIIAYLEGRPAGALLEHAPSGVFIHLPSVDAGRGKDQLITDDDGSDAPHTELAEFSVPHAAARVDGAAWPAVPPLPQGKDALYDKAVVIT